MNQTMFWLMVAAFALFGLPVVVYLIVKLGTSGYLMGRYRFEEWKRSKSNRRESRPIFHPTERKSDEPS